MSLKKAFLSLFSVVFLTTHGFGQLNTETKSGIKYLAKTPAKIAADSKLIILLHGVGSNEQDLFSLSGKLGSNNVVVSARAPLTLSENSFAWYHLDFKTGEPVINYAEEQSSEKLLAQFIDALAAKYKIPASKVFLIGFSQGSIMSYQMALHYPAKIKGIGVLSGRVLEETKEQYKNAKGVEKVNIFIAHGQNDQVLPIKHAAEARKFLDAHHLVAEYHEYQMKHEICAKELDDVVSWLSKH